MDNLNEVQNLVDLTETRYFVKVTASAKESNEKRKGEVMIYYLIKGGYVRKEKDLFNSDGTFKQWMKDSCYKRKWIAEREVSKVEDETWWYKSAELVTVQF